MRVFKYRGGPDKTMERDLRSLVANVFYASTSQELNDPFELTPDLVTAHGKFRRWLGLLKDIPVLRRLVADAVEVDDKVRGVAPLIQEVLSTIGIYALSRTGLSELLWAHYGSSHTGFCIEYDLEILLSLNSCRAVDVVYQEHLPRVSTADFWKMLFPYQSEAATDELEKKLVAIKSAPWSYEQETRLLTNPGPNEYDFRAVKAVHFGHRCTDKFKAQVMQELAGRDLRYFVVEPRAGVYGLVATPLEDPFADAKAYRSNMAPVHSSAIQYSGNDQRVRKLVERAVELVRRDPYCSFILKATFDPASNNRPDRTRVDFVRSNGEGFQVVRTLDYLENIDISALKSSSFHPGDFYSIKLPDRESPAG
jgi:hypothetical protein